MLEGSVVMCVLLVVQKYLIRKNLRPRRKSIMSNVLVHMSWYGGQFALLLQHPKDDEVDNFY